ncbi:tripartite-type tricarboxylate transporter receptor subunit TctC [Pseudorhodoplanes sinuspersici]|uniref:Uncharacterized protein n=2 Tax=Pseudorhodoplanes sinuspersici TaxID=1235591 RepID=A0A1W6ZSN0_9HYPH|nr:hypothetical protein CAK95_14240 [Pseudorhodoplanes sinuspersici]RKE71151.1 tripartite-type tricarboxylate transporter receptor subunit TctC [Pseudorhodoplanes sinuspersici]
MPKQLMRARRWVPTRRALLRGSIAAVSSTLAMPFIGHLSPALAAWPDRPIRFLVPFGTGGPVDVIARLIAPPLAESLKVSIFIENKVGAAGSIGVGMAARSDPDGYTILVTSNTMVINPLLYLNIPYDPVNDFLPLVDMAGSPTVFAVQPKLGVKNLKEFVALAKQRAGSLNYASSGFATPAHLAAEFLKSRAGIEMTHVPFNGGGPAVQGLLSGAVDMVSTALPGAHPQIVSGNLTAIGVTGAKRWFDLPDIPTMVEAGYSGFVLDTYTMMLLPAKTPREIADKLTAATMDILKQPEIVAKIRKVGFEVTAGDSESLKTRIAAELPLWAEVVKQAGIKPK